MSHLKFYFIELVTILVLFFGLEACRVLAPCSGMEPTTPALEGKGLTTGLLEQSPSHCYTDETQPALIVGVTLPLQDCGLLHSTQQAAPGPGHLAPCLGDQAQLPLLVFSGEHRDSSVEGPSLFRGLTWGSWARKLVGESETAGRDRETEVKTSVSPNLPSSVPQREVCRDKLAETHPPH